MNGSADPADPARMPDRTGLEPQTGLVVHRRLVLGEDDQVDPEVLSLGSMPLVTLRPRLNVSRIWTPSVMSLASSVRLISEMILSWDGISTKATAWLNSRDDPDAS